MGLSSSRDTVVERIVTWKEKVSDVALIHWGGNKAPPFYFPANCDVSCTTFGCGNNRAAIAGHSLASECPGRNYRRFAGQRLSGP